ncbi:hypothetical protein F4859DRAFT_509595 [Xylaria cf. heliscus]|nr:hypothetical protein F4859DRAFT_509595 [Xylaria cf. heliscus]
MEKVSSIDLFTFAQNMSKYSNYQVDDRQGNPEDIPEAPTGEVNDDSYIRRRGDDGPIDVVKDDAKIEDPVPSQGTNSDRQLVQDEKEAIDKKNVIGSRLRGNAPKPGAMAEPSDEEMGLME